MFWVYFGCILGVFVGVWVYIVIRTEKPMLRPEGWAAWAVKMMDGRLAIGVRRKAVAYLLYLSYSACFFLSPRM